jgi:hypothetical protein
MIIHQHAKRLFLVKKVELLFPPSPLSMASDSCVSELPLLVLVQIFTNRFSYLSEEAQM